MDTEQIETVLTFFKAVAQPERLKILGLLANRPYSQVELAKVLDRPPTAVTRHLQQLQQANLIACEATTYRLDVEALQRQNQSMFSRETAVAQPDNNDPAAKILRGCIEGEKIKQIPTKEPKLLIILQWLAEQFEWERRYSEKEVNELLKQRHPDFATLRRYLVDYRFFERDHGIYWRREV
jgi:hypothetical protein